MSLNINKLMKFSECKENLIFIGFGSVIINLSN